MKTIFNFLTVTLTLAIATPLTWATVTAQVASDDAQIEIVNQDGERVRATEVEIVKPKKDRAQAKAGVSVKQKDGKLIVTEADGSTREIDVQGAQSIIVNQSVKSVVENGEEKTESFGKAIIIGPDGQRQEIELGGPMEGGMAGLPGFKGVFKADRVANTYMIGVNCQPVSGALSSQLDLETGSGLVVLNVNTQSPAAAAGIQKHDILMFADDRQLGKRSDLVEAVQTAGKENTKISLTLLRGGKEIGIDVSPVERPATAFRGGFGMPHGFNVLPEINNRDFMLKWHELGPGVIMGDGMIMGGDDIDDTHVQMRKQMDEMRNQMKDLEKQFEDQIRDDIE